jgi:hypothetical protein
LVGLVWTTAIVRFQSYSGRGFNEAYGQLVT